MIDKEHGAYLRVKEAVIKAQTQGPDALVNISQGDMVLILLERLDNPPYVEISKDFIQAYDIVFSYETLYLLHLQGESNRKIAEIMGKSHRAIGDMLKVSKWGHGILKPLLDQAKEDVLPTDKEALSKAIIAEIDKKIEGGSGECGK